MKKVLNVSIIAFLLVSALSLNAQKFAVEGSYLNLVRTGPLHSSTYFNGIKLGGTVSYDLKNNFSLLSGALYSFVYSNKVQGYPDKMAVNYVISGHYLDIPVHLMYSLPLSKSLSLFAFAGPNLNVGLLQDQRTVSTLTPELNTFHNVQPGQVDLYKSLQLNRLNLQLGLGGGVKFKKYTLKSGYDFGVTNINRLDTGNLYQKGWYVTFSYEF